MNIDIEQLDVQARYRLLVGSVIPRPIAWVSTLSVTGVANLAPYSFFTVASCNPPVLSITQVNPRDRRDKDTLANLIATGEAVVNIASENLVALVNASCADYPPDVSEFSALNIESVASLKVAAPGVSAAKVRFECKLREILPISSLPMGGTMMLLDVVHAFVNEAVVEDDVIVPGLLDAVGRLGGNDYTTTRDRFALARPSLP